VVAEAGNTPGKLLNVSEKPSIDVAKPQRFAKSPLHMWRMAFSWPMAWVCGQHSASELVFFFMFKEEDFAGFTVS